MGSSTACLSCPAGRYCLERSSSPTGFCEEGYYCELGASGPQSKACSGGSYRNSTGATSQSDCSTCPLGYYCPVASVNPIICPMVNLFFHFILFCLSFIYFILFFILFCLIFILFYFFKF